MRAKTKIEQLERRADAITPDEDITLIWCWVDAKTGEQTEMGRSTFKVHRHFDWPPDLGLSWGDDAVGGPITR